MIRSRGRRFDTSSPRPRRAAWRRRARRSEPARRDAASAHAPIMVKATLPVAARVGGRIGDRIRRSKSLFHRGGAPYTWLPRRWSAHEDYGGYTRRRRSRLREEMTLRE